MKCEKCGCEKHFCGTDKVNGLIGYWYCQKGCDNAINLKNKMRTKQEYQEALDEMYRDARLLNLGSGCYATPETDKQKSKLQELIDNLKENK